MFFALLPQSPKEKSIDRSCTLNRQFSHFLKIDLKCFISSDILLFQKVFLKCHEFIFHTFEVVYLFCEPMEKTGGTIHGNPSTPGSYEPSYVALIKIVVMSIFLILLILFIGEQLGLNKVCKVEMKLCLKTTTM